LSGDTRKTSATEDGDELASEVIVEPAVEDRVGTRRAKHHEMTHSNDDARLHCSHC